jgi:hypothetical protein
VNGLFPALPPADLATEGADVAYTPDDVAHALLCPEAARFLMPPGARVWEPCAGGGAWIRALRAYRSDLQIHGTEIDSRATSIRQGLAAHGDALSPASCPWSQAPGTRWEVWTNPPFSLAGKMLRNWFDLPNPPDRVILLLLQAWPNAAERAWVRRHMLQQIILYPRISFGGPGRKAGQTDQRDYAIFEFTPQPWRSGAAIARWYDWRAREVGNGG